MVYAEMGTKPIGTYIKSRMFGYWLTIINSENSKLSKIMYNIMYSESLQGGTYKWLNYIKQILISEGGAELFSQDHINNQKAIKAKITQTLTIYLYRNGIQKLLCHGKVEVTSYLKKI